MKKIILIFVVLAFLSSVVKAQSLEDILDDKLKDSTKIEYTTTSFKTVRIINSHSIKSPAKGNLMFIISHRFGLYDAGFSDFFGLDQATIRLGFDYGINDRFSIGIGRSTYKSNYDFFVKYKLLRQSTGFKTMPISLSVLGMTNITSDEFNDFSKEYDFLHRVSYVTQLLIARKLNDRLTLQLIPTYIHKNIVPTSKHDNDLFAIGIGGRFKIVNRISLTGEYHYRLNENSDEDYYNSLSIGVNLETGGHVFQLFISNSSNIYDAAYITETAYSWLENEILFGFNISRVFGKSD